MDREQSNIRLFSQMRAQHFSELPSNEYHEYAFLLLHEISRKKREKKVFWVSYNFGFFDSWAVKNSWWLINILWLIINSGHPSGSGFVYRSTNLLVSSLSICPSSSIFVSRPFYQQLPPLFFFLFHCCFHQEQKWMFILILGTLFRSNVQSTFLSFSL